MAYRRSNGKGRQKSRKIDPAVKTLTFTITVPRKDPITGVPGELDSIICLSQCASLVNRRFYRQGLNWAVAGVKILSTPGTGGSLDGSIMVSKIPETWVMNNAWTKGFHTWKEMNDEALEETESVRPRFLDYKIYMDTDHHALGFGANLLPISESGVLATPGEWAASKMIIPDTTLGATGGVQEREIIAVGGNYPGAGASGLNAVSLIEGYAASRGLPNVLDPNAPDDAADTDGVSPENWMAATFNDGTQQSEEVLDSMVGPLAENNIAPYPFENDGVNTDTMYPYGSNQLTGLEIHDFELITGTTIGGTTRLKGGLFPCGLLKLFSRNFDDAEQFITMTVDLVPGPHRGYLAQSMLEA